MKNSLRKGKNLVNLIGWNEISEMTDWVCFVIDIGERLCILISPLTVRFSPPSNLGASSVQSLQLGQNEPLRNKQEISSCLNQAGMVQY